MAHWSYTSDRFIGRRLGGRDKFEMIQQKKERRLAIAQKAHKFTLSKQQASHRLNGRTAEAPNDPLP